MAKSMDDSGIQFRHPTASVVNATESLIEYYEDTDANFDLHIELKQDWNSFFKMVPIEGPSGDDSEDLSGVNAKQSDTIGANYWTFSQDLPHGDMKKPRARLAQAMDADGDGVADVSSNSYSNAGTINANSIYWAVALDSKNKNAENVSYNHMQSVAKGLVGLFSHSADLSEIGANNVIVVDPSAGDTNATPSAEVDPASANFEIRIDQDNLREWMSPSGEYGGNVFTETQLNDIFRALVDSGRTFTEGNSGNSTLSNMRSGTTYAAECENFRFLALRENDCIQVKIIVNDSVGLTSGEFPEDGNGDPTSRPNHRRWLLSLKQTDTGAFLPTETSAATKYNL